MLTADDRDRVRELFDACLELDADCREDLYRQNQATAEVREEVERLIRNHRPGTESIFRPHGAAKELLRDIPPLFAPGDVIGGRFVVIGFIQRGGMGEVYCAREGSGKTLAIKVVRPLHGATGESIRRFRREFASQSRIEHPNVCPVFELLSHETADGPVDFFTMEFLEGETLGAVLRKGTRLASAEVKGIALGVLRGLETAHSRGIIHRDLKPSNVMLVPQPNGGCRAVLLDFGLARLTDGMPMETTLTRTGEAFGTLDYMSPEQLSGSRADARSDLYAVGLIVYQMLTGVHPFRMEGVTLNVDIRKRRVPEIPPECGPIDAGLVGVIQACLQPDPADRSLPAGALIGVLEGRVRPPLVRVPRRVQRRAAIAAMIGASAAAALIYREQRQLRVARGVAVLIADGSTGDALTAKAIGFQFRNLLSRSQAVTLWNAASLDEVWRRMGRSGPAAPGEREWREIAFRERVGLVVFLSLDHSALTVRVQQVQGNPEKPWREWKQQFPAPSEDQVLAALESAGKWLRGLAGESAAEIANSSDVESVTTPSWRALKEFSRGEQLAARRQLEDALLAYSAALRLDADFTMAWMRTGDVEMSLGREKEAFVAWKGAVDSAQRRPLSRREDLKFRSMLASDGADYQAAEQLFAEYSHYFPDDWFGLYYREFPLMMLGRVEEAVTMLEKSLRFPDRRGRAHMKLAWAMTYKGDLEAARAHAAELKRMNLRALEGWANAVIRYVSGDADAALAGIAEAAKDPQLVSTTIHEVYRCNVLADSGRIAEAIRLAFDGAQRDLSAGRPAERAAKTIGGAALLAELGSRAECVRRLATIDPSTLGPQQAADMVMILARNGAVDRARQASRTLSVNLPYPRFQIARLRSDGELALAENRTRAGLESMLRAAALDSRAYGKQYLAYAQERSGNRQSARMEYQAHLRSKAFQLHSLTPEPAGSWRRSSEAVRRLT